jgi:hypothetical protein
VETKSALLNHSVSPGGKWPETPYPAVRRWIVPVVFLLLLVLEVITSDSVRASNHAIFASDTPSEVLDDDAIVTTIRRFCRAYSHTGGIVTMHARHGDKLRIDSRILAGGHRNHLGPENVSPPFLLFRGAMRDIVFFLASDRAGLASRAFI